MDYRLKQSLTDSVILSVLLIMAAETDQTFDPDINDWSAGGEV